MIDFACKRFDLQEIIKCALGLTKAELKVMNFFLTNPRQEFTTEDISKKLNLNLTTIQKAVKKLREKEILKRHQKNLLKGGYVFTYETNSKTKIKDVLNGIIENWSENVKKEIDRL